MSRFRLRVVDAPGQPARLYDVEDDGAAIAEADRMAADGYVGGTVEVIDTHEHPDRNVVHTARRDR